MFEHVIHYMFVPGKLENWTVIIDLEKIGVTDIPRTVRRLSHSFLGHEGHDRLSSNVL
jgi:hypothetical protein